MGRIQSIQALRFFAALLVVICHTFESAKVGAVGVDIFFVISGLIISKVASNRGATEFLAARFLRIYPIFWICSLPATLLAIHIGEHTLPRTLTSISLWPIFSDRFLQPYLVVGWTLSFEMLFYVATAVVLLDRRLLMPLAIAFGAVSFAAFSTGHPVLRFLGNPIIFEFMFGVFIGMAKFEAAPVRGIILLGVGVITIAYSDATSLYLPRYIFDWTAPERALWWGIPAAMIVCGFLYLEGCNWTIFPFLGDASYSIYLTHGLALVVFSFLPAILQIFAAVILGALVFLYIEKPTLSWLARSAFGPRSLAARGHYGSN